MALQVASQQEGVSAAQVQAATTQIPPLHVPPIALQQPPTPSSQVFVLTSIIHEVVPDLLSTQLV